MECKICMPYKLLSLSQGEEHLKYSNFMVLERSVAYFAGNCMYVRFLDAVVDIEGEKRLKYTTGDFAVDNLVAVGSDGSNSSLTIFGISNAGNLVSLYEDNIKLPKVRNSVKSSYTLYKGVSTNQFTSLLTIDSKLALVCIFVDQTLRILTLTKSNLENSNELIKQSTVISYQSDYHMEKSVIWHIQSRMCLLACYGDSYGFLVYRLERSFQTDVWTVVNENPLHLLRDHDCGWITSLSTGISQYYLCGDATGTIIIYRRTVNNADSVHLIEYFFEQKEYSRSPITVITSLRHVERHLFWIGDSNGGVTLIEVLPQDTCIISLKCIKLHFTATITNIMWNPYDPKLIVGRLRSVSADDGVLWESNVLEVVSAIIQVCPDLPVDEGHRSLVEVATFLVETNLLVTAGFGNSLFVWDVVSGRLVSSVESAHHSYTALGSHGDSSSKGTRPQIIASGHRSGVTVLYELVPTVGNGVSYSGEGIGSEGGTLEARGDPIASSLDYIESPPELLSVIASNSRSTSTDEEAPQTTRWTLKLLGTTSYFHLAVMDIFFSSLGTYVAFCYGRYSINVHSIKASRAVMYLQLDKDVIDVHAVQSVAEDYTTDRLHVAVHGGSCIRVLDAVAGTPLRTISLSAVASVCASRKWTPSSPQMDPSEGACHSIACSAVWSVPFPVSTPSATTRLKTCFITMCVTTYGDIHLVNEFGESTLLGSIGSVHAASVLVSNEMQSACLDNLVCGVKLFGLGCPCIAAVWSMRKVVLMRFNLSAVGNPGGQPVLIRSTSYCSDDRKARIITVHALKASPRERKFKTLVLFSNGISVVLQT